MAAVVHILDLLELTFDAKPKIENIKEHSLKLILEALILSTNVSDLQIELKEEDSWIIQEMTYQAKIDVEEQRKIESVSSVHIDNESVVNVGSENAASTEGYVEKASTVGSYILSEKHRKTSRNNGQQVSRSIFQIEKFGPAYPPYNKTLIEADDRSEESFIYLYQTQNGPESQPSAPDGTEQSPEPTADRSSRSEESEKTPKSSTDQSSIPEAEEKPKPLEYSKEIPEAKIIEKACLDFLSHFSKDCGDLKQIIEGIQEMFGEDFIETMRLVRQAADLADNNRLRQIYFHEGIYKKIRKAGPDEDFKPIRRGPREIIIRRAKDLAKDDEPKIGDLTASKEEVLREEKLLSKLVELEESSAKKTEEEPERSFIAPIRSSDELTITKLNEMIKEHEDIKCYLEYLIYHVNTLADFSEASIPIIFANDPSMEGLQQRMREMHLTPSEYIVTKKMQRELKEFFETFVVTVGDFDKRITNQGSLLIRLEGELKDKTRTLSSSIEGVKGCMKNVAKELNREKGTKKELGVLSEETLNRFQEEVDKINKELIVIFEQQRKMTSQLELLKALQGKIKDELFNIKSNKLEKIELQKLLATKADCSLLNSKVSETQFSIAYNDLRSSLTSLSNQLGGQNFIWEVLVKICKNSLNSAVGKDKFEQCIGRMGKEIKKVQKTLLKLKEKNDLEAIGVKTKYIRNLQCISCNREGKMKAANDYPLFPALPKLPHSQVHKNDQTGAALKIPSSDSVFTNRYVGGSHTIIVPKEKVLQKLGTMDVLFK